MTRQEHLDWCKNRALEYVERGELENAFTSFTSDLSKDESTLGALEFQKELGFKLLLNGHLDTPEKMREWIVGFN